MRRSNPGHRIIWGQSLPREHQDPDNKVLYALMNNLLDRRIEFGGYRQGKMSLTWLAASEYIHGLLCLRFGDREAARGDFNLCRRHLDAVKTAPAM